MKMHAYRLIKEIELKNEGHPLEVYVLKEKYFPIKNVPGDTFKFVFLTAISVSVAQLS